MQDGAIRWRHSLSYYREVATYFGNGTANYTGLQSWYRFYGMPGVGHCGTTNNVSAIDPFLPLVDWVEKGIAPDRLFASDTPSTRTRPLCPWPTTAIYKGTGSTDDWNNFTCGGNLDSNWVALCKLGRTNEKFENTASVNWNKINLPAICSKMDKDPLNFQ